MFDLYRGSVEEQQRLLRAQLEKEHRTETEAMQAEAVAKLGEVKAAHRQEIDMWTTRCQELRKQIGVARQDLEDERKNHDKYVQTTTMQMHQLQNQIGGKKRDLGSRSGA